MPGNLIVYRRSKIEGAGGAHQGQRCSALHIGAWLPVQSQYLSVQGRCDTLPCFLGVYWITQSLVMVIQQILINRHYDKIPMEKLIEQNRAKMNKKRARKVLPPLSDKATVNTKKLDVENKKKQDAQDRRNAKIQESTDYYNKQSAGSGSLASKANMVRDYNQKHNINTTRKKK